MRRLHCLVAPTLLLVALAGACSDDSSSTGAAGAAGAAGSAGAAGAADVRVQVKAMARDDLPCTTADDCCVVVDGCRATAYVVSATDRASAESLLSSAPNDACLKCVTPAIEVGCQNGRCVGTEIPASTAPPTLRQNHCGGTNAGAGGAAVHVLGCG